MTGRRQRVVAACVVLATLLVGCERPTVDGPVLVVDEDGRAQQVRLARAALSTPVPVVVAEARALRDELDRVWTTSASSAGRAALVATVDESMLLDAAATLATVELVGDGPDVQRVRVEVDRVVVAARALATAGPAELADLPALAAADSELAALPAAWNEPASRSVQLATLTELEQTARAAAAELDRRAVLPCTGVWDRRVAAATVVADRSAELAEHVRRRDGDAFDAARASFAQDPFDTDGRTFGQLDAEAARCWFEDSAVPRALAAIDDAVADLTAALDPEDLRARGTDED